MDAYSAIAFFGGGVRRLPQKGGGGVVLPSFRRCIVIAARAGVSEAFFICFHEVTRRIRHPYLLYSGTNHGAKSHHL